MLGLRFTIVKGRGAQVKSTETDPCCDRLESQNVALREAVQTGTFQLEEQEKELERENLVANLYRIRTKLLGVFLNVLPRLRCCGNLVLGCL